MSKILERKLINIVRRTVVESIQEAFNDPDYGLELTTQARRRLTIYRNKKKRISVPFEEVARRFA